MTFVATVERTAGGAAVVSPVGELDAYTAPELQEQLHRLADDDAIETLVVDLTRVSFLDSSALGVLVGALRRMREGNGELRLVEPRATVRRIFELTLLNRTFPFYPTPEEALAGSR